MIGLKPEEQRPERRDSRTWLALGASAAVHLLVTLLLIFGLPVSSASRGAVAPAEEMTAQPLTLQQPVYRQKQARRETPTPPTPTPSQPPPPPPHEVELGPDSKKPDARAKEAAAKQTVPEAAPATPPTKVPEAAPQATAAAPDDAKPQPQPAAPQQIRMPRPGDYAKLGAVPLPTTSPWGPPKLDSASGAPASAEIAAAAPSSMGRAGLPSRDPGKWENSFDDETSGRCVAIPDLGKNADGSPVLATVIGRVLDTDGRTPLSGAHLQIMGTQFGTFSSSAGEYRLEFDPRLLAKCRKQYIDVVAPGYQRQLLTLMIGTRVRSDDVVLHHH